jgi:CHAT domain-containing protein
MAAPFVIEPKILQFMHENFSTAVTEVIAMNEQLSCFLMKDAGQVFRDAILAKKEENKERYANRKNKTVFESTIDNKIEDSNNELKNITVSPVKKKSESWF